MSDIRVIVGKIPKLLGEIILAALVREGGVRIVGEAESEDELVHLCARVRPDVIVLGSLEADAEAIGHRLLHSCPFAKVVALASDGRTTFLFELRPQKVDLGELALGELGHVVARLLQPASGPTP